MYKILCPYCKHELTKEEIGSLSGQLGGNITKTRHGKAHYSAMGKKGMEVRWGKTRQS